VLMLAKLNSIFSFASDDDQVTRLMKAVLIDGAAVMAGKAAAGQLTKLIPGVGSAANAVVAGVLTLVLGESYMQALKELAIRKAQGKDVDIAEIVAIFNLFLKQLIASRGRTVPKPD